MNQTNSRILAFRRLLVLAILIAVLGFAYQLYSTLQAIKASGILVVSAPAPGTSISVTQGGHTAAFIGNGSARVRLKPGVYLVGARVSGELTTKTATITRGHTTAMTINPAVPSQGAQVIPLSFINTDQLVNNGLTSTQETFLEELFTAYKPKSQIVSIDSDSISVIAPDSTSDNSIFKMNFTGTIDKSPFRANVQYDGFDNIDLTLYDSSGTQLYAGSKQATPS